jgi:DNA end-binding protein Ku
VVKGYEYSPGEYVVVERQEIQRAVAATSKTMDIQHFVKLSEIDPVFFERSYYLAPEKEGEKVYALLFHGMQRSGYCAVATVAMHRREHVLILRPSDAGIVAHTMFYVDEIREAPEVPTDLSLVTKKELDLAETFINGLAGPFKPEAFRDEYAAKLKALIEAKVQGREIPETAPVRAVGETLDIMEALKKSLAQLDKQPLSGSAATGHKKLPAAKPKRRRSA